MDKWAKKKRSDRPDLSEGYWCGNGARLPEWVGLDIFVISTAILSLPPTPDVLLLRNERTDAVRIS